MSLNDLIPPKENGYHILKLTDVGEIHLELSKRADSENGPSFWEASIYSPQDQSGPLQTLLHVIADSREELIRELDRALFSSPKTD
jgi:hypothetical protein